MDSYFWNRLFRSVLTINVLLSVLIVFLLAMRPILDRRISARFRVRLWWVLLLGATYVTTSAYGDADVKAPSLLQITLPSTELVWTDDSPLPGLAEPMERLLSPEDVPVQSVSLINLAAYLWAAGAVGVGAYFLFRELAFGRRVRRWSLPAENETLLKIVRQVEAEFNEDATGELAHIATEEGSAGYYNSRFDGKSVRVLVCPLVSGPMMAGSHKPTLLLPHDHYDPKEFYYICRHELTHFQEDHITLRKMILFFNAFYWFNPFLWILRRETYRNMELDCDDVALCWATAEEKRRYCELLLSAVPPKRGDSSACTTYFRGSQQVLRDRIAAIWRRNRRKSAWLLYFLLYLCMSLGCSLGVSTARASATRVEQGLSQPVGYRTDRADGIYEWVDSYLQNLEALPPDDPYRIPESQLVSLDKLDSTEKGVTYLQADYTVDAAQLPPGSPYWAQGELQSPTRLALSTVYRIELQDIWYVCTGYAQTAAASEVFPDMKPYPPKQRIFMGVDFS